MRRFELMLFPLARKDPTRLGGHFDALEEAQAEARRNPDCEFRILDHHNGDMVVDQSP